MLAKSPLQNIWIFLRNKLTKIYFRVMCSQLYALGTLYKEERMYANIVISFLHSEICNLERGNTYLKVFNLSNLVLFVPKTTHSTLHKYHQQGKN